VSSPGKLRWIIFTSSVISTVDNPDAHLWRALGVALARMSQSATFYEPRANAPLRALLERSGSRALAEFRARHAEIVYRTHEQRRGADLVEWMSRTLATADVALIQSTASPNLIAWLGKLTRPHLRTFLVDTGWNTHEPASSPSPELASEMTAFLLGDEQLVARYRQATPSARILTFGPLPSLDSGDDQWEPDATMLASAVDRLIDAVIHTNQVAPGRPSSPDPNGLRH